MSFHAWAAKVVHQLQSLPTDCRGGYKNTASTTRANSLHFNEQVLATRYRHSIHTHPKLLKHFRTLFVCQAFKGTRPYIPVITLTKLQTPKKLTMSLRILTLALTAFALSRGASAQVWAQFCDDNACAINCGESVDVSNPGCLDESGRNSILFHEGDLGPTEEFSLVFSPEPGCNCQNECIDSIAGPNGVPGCYDLNGNQFATSFRFIGGSCGGDNC